MIRQQSAAKRVLTDYGVSLIELAAVCGLTQQGVSKHLAGRSGDSSIVVDAVATLVGPDVAAEVAEKIADARRAFVRKQDRTRDGVVVPLRLVTDPSAGSQAIRLYIVLRAYADKSIMSPSRRQVADMMGCSPDTVDRAARWLVDAGWLTVESRVSGDGQTTNRYTLRDDVEVSA